MYDGKLVKCVKEDSIAILTLSDPKGLNFVSWNMLLEIEKVQDLIDADKSIRVVVIKAAGEHFSAGIDLKELYHDVDSRFIMDQLVWLQRVYGRWQELPMPVIASIHGLCYGAATEMILGCDIRIAADNSRFSIPEVRFGLSPDQGGTTRLTKLVGVGQAKRMIMGCEELDAVEAKSIGLVEIMVELDKLDERTMKMANKMANLPPVALRFAKKGINLASESSVGAGLLFEQAQSTYCCGTEDQNEALAAFFEKRKPVFKGK